MQRLNEQQCKILNILLDKYESSKTYAGENRVNQSFTLRPADVYPGYESNYEPLDRVNAFEDGCIQLEKCGFVTISRKRETIAKIRLNMARVADIYAALGRKERKDILGSEEAFYESQLGDNAVLDRACGDELERIRAGKRPRHSVEEAEPLCRLVRAIVHNESDILERELSISVFGDSKVFEAGYRTKACRLIMKYRDPAEMTFLEGIEEPREREIALLEGYNIYTNPDYVYLKGDGEIVFSEDKACRDSGEHSGAAADHVMILNHHRAVALSADAIRDIEEIRIDAGSLMTIENLTSFNRMQPENTFCLYISGYHNHLKQKLLQMIEVGNADLYWRHFGDIDPDGFMILRNLCARTGIDFVPYHMDIAQLEQYEKYGKPLNRNDRVKAKSLITADYHADVMQYMLDHDVKLEQEIVSWMER